MEIGDFSKETISGIIEGFSKEGHIFTNEKQFQFELGKALYNATGQQILFEILSIDHETTDAKKKKLYTDLVIDFGNNQFVCIELKYKSAEKPTTKTAPLGYDETVGAFKYGNSFVFPQGAEDEGSYYFLQDVERLEKLVDGDIPFRFDRNNHVEKSYAVIMTNSKKYWEGPKKDDAAWSAFQLTKGTNRTNRKRDKMCWKEGTKHANWPPIKLRGDYLCDWTPYFGDKSAGKNTYDTAYPFQYMIWEIL